MDDIFTEVDLPQDDNPDKDYVTELVGEGRKYKDHAALAKGAYHANQHIQTLEEKLDELRKELETRTKMEDFMTQVKEVVKPGNQSQPQSTPAPVTAGNEVATPNLEQQIEALLAAREAKRSSQSNLDKVTSVMKANFGDDAVLVINRKAQELGMSPKSLQQIAVDSPTAFFNLVGAQENVERPQTPAVPRSNVNTVGGAGTYSPLRNAAFYERMKRENPSKYFDPKTTSDMINDRRTLGDKWY